jgi:hypothetical protein
MACPFFMPVQKFEGGAWHHPSRLPLGTGWRGHCTAAPMEGVPTDQHIQDCCNLGYASECPRLPEQRTADAVRFGVLRFSQNEVELRYVCEKNHRPGEHGTLTFLKGENRWVRPHSDPRIQKMAECYLDSYLVRRDSTSGSLSNLAMTSEPS